MRQLVECRPHSITNRPTDSTNQSLPSWSISSPTDYQMTSTNWRCWLFLAPIFTQMSANTAALGDSKSFISPAAAAAAAAAADANVHLINAPVEHWSVVITSEARRLATPQHSTCTRVLGSSANCISDRPAVSIMYYVHTRILTDYRLELVQPRSQKITLMRAWMSFWLSSTDRNKMMSKVSQLSRPFKLPFRLNSL